MVQSAEEFLNNKFTEIYNRKPLSFKEKLPLTRYLELYVTGRIDGVEENYPEMMVEFTKLHREAILKEVSEKVILESRLYSKFGGKIEKTEDLGQEINLESQIYIGVNKSSILNAYPLENIK